jgi:hypothetical protein
MVVRLPSSKAKGRLPKSHHGPKRWSRKEIFVLRQIAGKEPLWRLAQILGRSPLSIRWKAKQEGISLSWNLSRKSLG